MAIKRLQLRRDTASNWTTNNPTLLAGEMGVETDTGKFKVGDGVLYWTNLPYSSGPVGSTGRGYGGVTSTTSNAIAIVPKTFSTPSTGAFTVGQRVRAYNTTTPTNYVEGLISSLTTDSQITINVDAIGGSGTFAAWTFVAAGQPGSTGATGTGLVTGGTTGQVLKKNSATNYDASWVDQSTLVAGDTSKVNGKTVYIQTTDPGAVGAGVIWIQTV